MKKFLIAALILCTCICLLAFAGCGSSPAGGAEDMHTHISGSLEIENEQMATCYAEGSYDEVIYCTDCYEEISRESKITPKTEHIPSEPCIENETFSTCDEAGSYDVVIYCMLCPEELSRETTTVEKTEHIPTGAVIENIVDATCTKEGSYDVVIYCIDCDGIVSKETKAIEKLSHTPSSSVRENEIEATCEENGSYQEVVYCYECETELSRVEQTIEKKDHSPSSPVKENEIEGTCLSDYTYESVIYCDGCNVELSRESRNDGKGDHIYNKCICSVCDSLKVSEGLQFIYNDDKTSYRVSDMGSCTDTEVSIPSTYNGLPVTGIYKEAFKNRTCITYVLLPDSITYIDASAFEGCTELTSITVPNGVTSIANDVFEGCTSLTSVIIPDNLTSFGTGVFSGCSNIQYNEYDNAYYLGSVSNPYAYLIMAKDKNITSCTIHPSTRVVRGGAFYSCEKLEEITVPKSVEIFEQNVFYMCYGMKSVYITDVAAWCNTQFASCPGEYSFINLYVNGEKVTDLVIPDGVTVINRAAFEGFSSLNSVAIPNTVTKIDDFAFAACHGLTSITIPDSVQTIGKSAFASSNGLTSIALGNGIKSIDENAFQNSKNITSVYVKDIAVLCNISYADLSSHPVQYYYADLYLNGELVTDLVIPDGVTSIADYAFSRFENFETVVIPEGVKSIGKLAFAYCSSIKSVYIPNSITSIAPSSFIWCFNINTTEYNKVRYIGSEENPYLLLFQAIDTKMTSCVVNPKTKFIHDEAFSGCNQLSSITMPNDLECVGDSVFKGCRNLKNIYISDIASWCSASFESFPGEVSGEMNLYLNGNLVTEINIPNGVTTVSDGAFYNCKNVTGVTIPNSVTKIGKSSFYGCTSIESLKLPFLGGEASSSENKYLSYVFLSQGGSGTVPATLSEVIITGDSIIGSGAFKGYSQLTNIELLGNITSIGYEAFYGCTGLTNLVIPKTVTSIGNHAFMKCTSLESITMPFVKSSTSSALCFGSFFGSYNYKYNNNNVPSTIKTVVINGGDEIPDYAFYECASITSITVSNSITSIGKGAFEKCDGLESISLPFIGNSLDSAENAYFAYVFGASKAYDSEKYVPAALKAVSITSAPNGIPEKAFYGCTGISTVTLPDAITSIGDYAFDGCTSLTSVNIPQTVTKIGTCAFRYCSSIKTISIPSAIIEFDATVGTCTSLEYNEYQNGYYLGNESNPYVALIKVKDENITSFTVHPDTVLVDFGTLQGCTSITSITLPFVGHSRNYKANTHLGYIFGADSYSANERFVPKTLNTVTVVGDSPIGGYAFNSCTYLKNIYLEGDILSIGTHAFDNCKNLTNLTVPSSIRVVEEFAFVDCTNLRYNEKNSVYYLGNSKNPYVVLKSAKSNITSCTIDANTKVICNNAFYECYGLTRIVISQSVEYIGNAAFFGCKNLEKIIINDGVTHIGKRAFYGCTSIESISLPQSVTTLGEAAFYGCTGLKSVSIGSGINVIRKNTFYQCSSITDVYYSGSESDWNKITVDSTNTVLKEATIHYNQVSEQ